MRGAMRGDMGELCMSGAMEGAMGKLWEEL